MNNLPNIQDFMWEDKFVNEMESDDFVSTYSPSTVERMLREYGQLIRDRTLEWAAENAYIFNDHGDFSVDTDSILDGKTSKDLEI